MMITDESSLLIPADLRTAYEKAVDEYHFAEDAEQELAALYQLRHIVELAQRRMAH